MEILGEIKQIFVGVRQILNSGAETAGMPWKMQKDDKSHLLRLMQRRYAGANCLQSVPVRLPMTASSGSRPRNRLLYLASGNRGLVIVV